jgi:putative heme-binding domain-containing protein
VEIWGPIDAVAKEKQATFEKYRALLTSDRLAKADASTGRALFRKTCGGCHRLFELGGRIGPELTGANRGDMNYLLGNILTPSEVIQDAYRMSLVLTNEGRLYSGILAGESERHIELRVVGENEPVVIPKSTIASREVAPVSMMPDGILNDLTDANVLDLVKYLQAAEQVPPKE